MVYARAHMVFVHNVILVAIVTKVNSTTLPILRSRYGVMDSVVDEWTRVFQITPYLEEKFFESHARSVAYGMSNAWALRDRMQRARHPLIKRGLSVCDVRSVMIIS